MGSMFLNLFAWFLIFLVLNPVSLAKGPILFDAPPVPIEPPEEEGTLEEKVDKIKERQKKRQEKSTPAETTKTEVLSIEATKERDYVIFSQVSLIVPYIAVSGPRADYTTELTSHFSLNFRATRSNPLDKAQVWVGLRVAPFSGTGVYEDIPGRYGFLYFGPSLSFGSIQLPPPVLLGGAISSDERKKILQFPKREFWMLSTGIAAQSRNGIIDPTAGNPGNDINSVKGITFDRPGWWCEYTKGTIYYGTLSVNYSAGIQLGEGKTLVWLGIGLGAWD